MGSHENGERIRIVLCLRQKVCSNDLWRSGGRTLVIDRICLSNPHSRPCPPPLSPPQATLPAPPAEPSLADEVASLRAAKLALESGRTRDGLRLIDAFFVDFPHAHLRPEAEALRIEALAAGGDREGARSFLRAFRAAHPDSQLLPRLEKTTAP